MVHLLEHGLGASVPGVYSTTPTNPVTNPSQLLRRDTGVGKWERETTGRANQAEWVVFAVRGTDKSEECTVGGLQAVISGCLMEWESLLSYGLRRCWICQAEPGLPRSHRRAPWEEALIVGNHEYPFRIDVNATPAVRLDSDREMAHPWGGVAWAHRGRSRITDGGMSAAGWRGPVMAGQSR